MGYKEVGDGQLGESASNMDYFKEKEESGRFTSVEKNYKDNRVSMVSHPDSYKEELADEVSDLGAHMKPSARPTLDGRSASFGDGSPKSSSSRG